MLSMRCKQEDCRYPTTINIEVIREQRADQKVSPRYRITRPGATCNTVDCRRRRRHRISLGFQTSDFGGREYLNRGISSR